MAEFYFDGDESSFINGDRLSKTVKFVPSRRQASVSAGELLNALAAVGIQPEDIAGVYKVSQNDYSFSVQFCFTDTAETVSSLQKIKVGDASFDIMKMNEQVVSLRVHWLPLYYDSLILKEALQNFGEVIDVSMLKTAHANCVTLDGVREVRLKTDERNKHKIPHIIHFSSGQSVLVTMQGRPPYCLKCKTVGHVRQRCPTNNRSFAQVVEGPGTAEPVPVPPPAPVAPVTSPAEPSDSVGEATESHVGDNAAAKGTFGQEQSSQPPQEMDLDLEKGLKRARESQEGASEAPSQLHSPGHRPWITPNKVAKSVAVPQGTLPLSNSFDPGLEIGELVIDA